MAFSRRFSKPLFAVAAVMSLAAIPVVSSPALAASATRSRTGSATVKSAVKSAGKPAVKPAVAAAVIHDGSSSGRAAASCWEIKQSFPASTDGVYWLQTPQLIAPQQIYCDMTTDGGGWELIGRGREGWQWLHNGQGAASAVRTSPTGPDAFAPATLSADTVQGLLGGTRVDALPDGIRVRRATNQAGTSWQEMRLMTTARPNWSWAIGGGIHLSAVKVNGVTYSGTANTQSWAANGNTGLLRLTATDLASHNYKQGFSYGSTIAGVNNATSYLWQYTTEREALPFAQVFIRPKITSPVYSAIPDSGTTATTVRALLGNKTSPTTTWGVTGLASGGATGEVVEVEDLAFIGRTVYVAGKFKYVQHGADGEQIQQSYLAAFDVDTGEWKSQFRPVLDATAWALAATPDGKLFVGGEFTNVDGAADTSSVAQVDPTTGAVVDGWRAPVSYEGSDTPNVRSLVLQGSWLYIGGRFNHIAGGSPVGNTMLLRSLARVNLTTGAPDGNWKPNVDGTIFELNASAQGDRIYLVGNFNNVNFTASPMKGEVSTDSGAASITGLTDWVPSTGSGTKTYQQTILEVGNDVWQGGSEHILSKYDRNSYNRIRSNITRSGGDFQVLAVKDGVIYGGCHCVNYNYSDDLNYSSPIDSASDVNGIHFIGAWDEATGDYLPQFFVSSLSARNDMGPWAFREGPDNCLWFGGDFTGGSYVGSTQQWLGGFGKLCPRDTTAPTAPTKLAATVTDAGVNLSWGASTDDSSLSYEVLRDDRVVATTTGRTWTDPDATLPSKYWVRAVDAQGNRSNSTPALLVQTPDVTPPTVSISSPADGLQTYGPVQVTVEAADDRGIDSVKLQVDGITVDTDSTAPYALNWNATDVGSHTLTAVATDTSGNTTTSVPVTVIVPADTTAPSKVTGLTVTGTTPTKVSLSWDPATDDRAVSGYLVSRNGNPLPGPVTDTTFDDSPLLPATSYTYTVQAVDKAGNVGAASAEVSAKTDQDPALLFSDTWSGGDGAAWSTPWVTSTSNGTVSTSGGAGTMSFSDVSGAYARAQLGATATADTELLTSYRWNENTANSFLTVYLRGSGGWQNSYRPKNGYGLQLSPTSATVLVVKNVNGTTSTIHSVTGAQTVSTAKQWLRLRVVGSTIQFKIWTDGQSEPSAWTATDTDTDVTAAGQPFISLNRSSTNTGTKTVSLDDLTLRSVTP